MDTSNVEENQALEFELGCYKRVTHNGIHWRETASDDRSMIVIDELHGELKHGADLDLISVFSTTRAAAIITYDDETLEPSVPPEVSAMEMAALTQWSEHLLVVHCRRRRLWHWLALSGSVGHDYRSGREPATVLVFPDDNGPSVILRPLRALSETGK